MLADGSFLMMLRSWTQSPLANMHMERLIALVLGAVGRDRNPLAERVLSSGYLAPLLSNFLKAGGRDPRFQTREEMLQLGADLRAAPKPDRTRQLPGQLNYSNIKLREEKRLRISRGIAKPSKEECRERQIELGREFNTLDAEARLQFSNATSSRASAGQPQEVPGRQFADYLWGLNTRTEVIDGKEIRNALLRACPEFTDDDVLFFG